jgi:hypothetical protein
LSSAVTVISKENEKNTEEINNLKDIIKQLAVINRPIGVENM